MFADKTSTLITLIREAWNESKKVMVIKPSTDNRYEEHELNIIAHNGKKHPSHSIVPSKLLQFIESPDFISSGTVFIDEYHFFEDIAYVVKLLIENQFDVVVSGIDLNYHRLEMPAYSSLERMAKTHIRLKSTCKDCGKLAAFTKIRKEFITENGTNIVGGAEKYAPSCDSCFFI
jgi:thymidine kinase